MNCQECRASFEWFLDGALKGGEQRKVSLHLSHCAECRSYFDKRRQGHADAYRAMNAALADEHLPDGFSERLHAFLVQENVVPQKQWKYLGMFRRIAAVLAAMLLFAGLSYAAAVAVHVLGDDESNQETVGGEPLKVAGSPAAVPAHLDEPVADTALPGGQQSGDEIPQEHSSVTYAASSLSESHNQKTGGTSMNKTKVAAATLSAVLSAVNAASSDVFTNALVASDFAKKDSFTNANCWSNIVTGVRGVQGEPLNSEWDYLVNNKLYCCSPSENSGSAIFQGRSLTIGNSSSEGNFRTYCYRDADLVFNAPGLFLANGTFYVEANANSLHKLSGAVTILATTSKPFVFRPDYTNMTLRMDAALYGSDNAAADVYCPSGKEPFFVEMANANSVYSGKIRVKCDRKSFLNGRPPVSLKLGTAEMGMIEVCAYSLLQPCVPTDVITAKRLILNDKACLSVGATVGKTDDGSVMVANGGFVVGQELTLPEGDGKVLLTLPEEPMMKAPSYRMPLLSAPAGSVNAEKFDVLPFGNGYVPPCRLVVETKGDIDTLYVDWDTVVKISTDTGAMNGDTKDSCLVKDDCWSDRSLPHGGVNYVAGVIDGNTNNVRMQGSSPYVFPGKSLSLFPGCTMYCFIGDMTVTNLNLLGGATVKHAKNMYLDIRGEKINIPSGDVYFDTYDTHVIRLHAPLSGEGTLVVRGHATTSSPKGNVRLEVASPEFKGSIHVTSQWIKNQRNSMWNGIFAEKPQWQTLQLAGPESLGAALDVFNPKSMVIDTFGELKIEKSMAFKDKTRGFWFGDAAQISIPSGKEASFLSRWTLGGEVFVRSGGVLALGGDMCFTSGKGVSENPQSGKNLLTFPEGGSLKVLSRRCIDGATVTFSNTTSRLVIAADTDDQELAIDGVKNTKTDAPFAFPGDSLNVEFALTGATPLSDKVRRLGLMTVSSKAAECLRNRLYVNVPKSVLPKWMAKEIKETVDVETGDVTFYLSMRPVGFQVIVR